MKNIQILLSFVSILIFSCETVVDIDIPIEQPLLVVNSTLSEDEFIKVNVSLSQHILDSEPYRMVEGAIVEIYEEDKLLTTLPDSAYGNYISATTKPIRGKNYQVKVSKAGFTTATSAVLLPLDTAVILNVKLDTVEITEFDYTYESLEFNVEINDDGSKINFYEIAIYIKYYNYSFDDTVFPIVPIDSFLVYNQLYLNSPDPSLEEFQSSGQSIIISDDLFNGHSYTMKLLSNSFYTFPEEYPFDPMFYVTLNNTSESYYLYQLSSQLQQWTTGDPFAQPVTVYNNIENGFGIFGAYNTAVVKVE